MVLCNYLIELAKSRFSPFLQNNLSKTTTKSFDQFTVADVSFKRAEQLVIYMKCLQLLKPVLSYAKDELDASRLKSTVKVRKIMRQLNNMYKFCLYQSKQLYITEFNRNKWNSEKIYLNADKLLYIHAIELCREAAMEEFFGKPQKVLLTLFQHLKSNNRQIKTRKIYKVRQHVQRSPVDISLPNSTIDSNQRQTNTKPIQRRRRKKIVNFRGTLITLWSKCTAGKFRLNDLFYR